MGKQHKKQEATLKIISMYRERELLWNTNSVCYHRNDLKTKAREEIARENNMTEECVRKKIKSLRSTYIIEKKKVDQSKNSGCDAADVYEPSLFWYGEMSFLDAFISTRKPKDKDPDNTLHESIYVDDATASKSFDSDISCTPSASRKRKREDDINTDKFDEAIDKILNIRTLTIDAFSTFAESMAMTLRAMPEETAYLTMKEIQDLLFRRKFNKVVATATEFQKRERSFPDRRDSSTLYLEMSDTEVVDDPLTTDDSLLENKINISTYSD